MLRLLFLLTTLWVSNVYSQQYFSYSFSGLYEDNGLLDAKILKIDDIQSCKIRYKEEQKAGEILFELKAYDVEYNEKGELKNPSPLIQLKDLLFNEGLEPIELIEIKN